MIWSVLANTGPKATEINTFSIRAFGCWLICSLGACSTVAPLPYGISELDRQTLYGIKSWVLIGRLGINTPDNSWQVNLDWSHLRERDQLEFAGPFGQGAVMLSVEASVVEIADSKGRHRYSGVPEQIIEERFGVRIPISALSYWVLGLEQPGIRNQKEFDADGFLRRIFWEGWEVRIIQYQNIGSYTIPRKIEITRDQIRLKLVVDDWQRGA